MLVLSRKLNEKVVIDGGITVTIVAIRGDKIRLGFEAPESVQVDRLEVWKTKQKQEKQGLESDNGERGNSIA